MLTHEIELIEIAQSTSEKEVQMWHLAMQAQHFPYRITPHEHVFSLFVPISVAEKAKIEVQNIRQELYVTPLPSIPQFPISTTALFAPFAFLIAVHLLAQSLRFLYTLGALNREKFFQGEIWRTTTSLFLHADGLHLFGNVLFGLFFVWLLMRYTGGFAWLLTLGAGILGNVINVFFQDANYASIGASTAVFGAMGVVLGISVSFQVLRQGNWFRQFGVPLTIGLLLFALFGISQERNTDVGAHFWGLLAGFILGFIFSKWRKTTP